MLLSEKLEKAFKKVEKDNWMLRAFLKGQDSEEVDRIVHRLHKELFEGFDCVKCSNCCKTIVPIIEENEIELISSKLGLKCEDFKNKYLVKEQEAYMINKKPCPFLTAKGCSIYEHRPINCREYPFTDKEEICSRLSYLIENCPICPVVFEILERLKKHYRNSFEEYKVEYERMWGSDDEYEDEYDDMEEWEAEVDFFDKEDWKGLVEYRRQKVENHTDDPDYQWRLGEAYVFNKEYEKAISFLGDLHKKYPDDPNIQHSLLDALFAIGKDETAVNWVTKPNMLKLDKDTLDYCYNFLKTKRKPRTVHDLYLKFYNEGYPVFNDNQLMALLYTDNRFSLTGSNVKSYDCFISVNYKK